MSDDLKALVALIGKNHPTDELALGWLRYEYVRRLNMNAFRDLFMRNLNGEAFDGMIDEALRTWRKK